MKIPKYVKNLLKNSRFVYLKSNNENYAIGYTFEVFKPSCYMHIGTFKKEIERICNWANKQIPNSAHILFVPAITRYNNQYAIITIYDPVMKYIEHLIKE